MAGTSKPQGGDSVIAYKEIFAAGGAGVSLYTDARTYDSADAILEALELYAAAQGAHRIGVRCLRPLYHRDGSPVMREDRLEQLRAVLAGVFSRARLRDVAEQIAELNGRAADDPRDRLGIPAAVGLWNCYFHAQRVAASITDRLLPGRAGTVRADGIESYTTIVGDLDPTAHADPGEAVGVAEDLAQVLTQIGRRIDPRAIMVQQSGRGAYVLINIEPQPLRIARPVVRDALRTFGRLVKATDAAVEVDAAVHDPARIIRIAGTTNHKLGADPCTPAWILRPWTPSVRAPWSAIEALAAPQRPRLHVLPGGRKGPRPANHQPLRELFTLRGWLYGERPDGVCDVRCPQADLHTDGRDGAILYPPTEPGAPGWVKCLHAHCAGMTAADVYRALREPE